jgi:dTDP-4-dehydrorhamnose 3,5-epimerase
LTSRELKSGAKIVVARQFEDERGLAVEFNTQKYYVRELRVISRLNVLRGVHFQDPRAAPLTKILTVESGKIFEVLVNLRTGETDSLAIDSRMPVMLVVPPWTAHGYLSMDVETVVRYRFDAFRREDCERVIKWNTVEAAWPVKDYLPIVSEKDRNAPPLETVLAEFKA